LDLAQESSSRVASYLRRKVILDRMLATLLLLPALPLLAVLILIIRATSRGPAIFKQLRTGRHGCPFTMYKLRSMRQDAEKRVGPVWASTQDVRVTRIGHLLRKLHLDELPQLFNVLKGEMSLIGPRPERPEFVVVLSEQIPGYADRLAVLPGVTGLAQINLPPDQTLDDVRRKLVLDREYIAQAGFWLDLRMLFCTLLRMVGVPGALATRITCLERRVVLPAAEVESGGESAEVTPADLALPYGRVVQDQDNLSSERYGNGKHAPYSAAPHRRARGEFEQCRIAE
jgi:lipopolysaccharide/colanic/teichoic acid biosynthesis glycosyltransferase